jgi:flavin reductase (DIM6/NTAB) family NADH-FMN oxidoreductase RutF
MSEFRSIAPATLDRRQSHLLLTSAIVPRPIAFVATIDPHGNTNLAPFSFYNGVSSTPPILSLSIAPRQGRDKDTLANIRASGELVVMAATESLASAVNQSSADYPPEVSEIEACGLTAVPSEKVRPPRVAESPLAMECRLVQLVERPGGSSVTLVLAEVVLFHLDPSMLAEDGTADPRRLGPLARLGGQEYAGLGAVFSQPRPTL